MQRLTVGVLRPEMVAAVDVVDPLGKNLIRAGTAFQESHINLLVENGFKSGYVSLSPFTAAVPEPILATDMHNEGLKLIRQVYTDFIKGEVDVNPLRDFASRLVNQVVINRTTPFQWIDLRSTDDYLPAHVLNVAVLSILIGLKSEYTPTRLHELAVGALLMDIGEMSIAPEILKKKDKLTAEEMLEVKKHPELGFDGMRKKIRGLATPSMHVAYQHHESFDGSGYPRGIVGAEIHEYARIAAVADMYDALLSDRPFRHYYLPNEAASILQAFSGKILDPEMVSRLLSQVAVYPQGSLVQVDSGEFAEVDGVEFASLARPKLRLLTDAWGTRQLKGDALDLQKQRSRHIKKVLKDQEIVEWITS
jgi:HD-GYP domain-containing protein (c-di-GMP phosphodiesterase class II)